MVPLRRRFKTALSHKVRLGRVGIPVWGVTLVAMLGAAVAGQAMGPLESAGQGAVSGGQPPTGNLLAGTAQPKGGFDRIISPPIVQRTLTDGGRVTRLAFYNNATRCDLSVEVRLMSADGGHVESAKVSRYVDQDCDGALDSLNADGSFDREPRTESFFQARDREYAAYLQALGAMMPKAPAASPAVLTGYVKVKGAAAQAGTLVQARLADGTGIGQGATGANGLALHEYRIDVPVSPAVDGQVVLLSAAGVSGAVQASATLGANRVIVTNIEGR